MKQQMLCVLSTFYKSKPFTVRELLPPKSKKILVSNLSSQHCIFESIGTTNEIYSSATTSLGHETAKNTLIYSEYWPSTIDPRGALGSWQGLCSGLSRHLLVFTPPARLIRQSPTNCTRGHPHGSLSDVSFHLPEMQHRGWMPSIRSEQESQTPRCVVLPSS